LRIVWTDRALIHIEAIGAYLGERSPAAKARILGAIGKGVERLALHPFSGRVGRAPRTRELVITRCAAKTLKFSP
jgi:plasmid stabilization system protein ParE